MRHEVEKDERQYARNDHAAIERRHDLRAANPADTDEHGTDDRCHDRNGAQQQREGHHPGERRAEEKIPEQHRRDRRHAIRFEEVRSHTGAVADVVADVVGDHCRVTRIVLGDAGLDLSDQVGADVGSLRVDAAAETREDRDQRAAKR